MIPLIAVSKSGFILIYLILILIMHAIIIYPRCLFSTPILDILLEPGFGSIFRVRVRVRVRVRFSKKLGFGFGFGFGYLKKSEFGFGSGSGSVQFMNFHRIYLYHDSNIVVRNQSILTQH